MINYFSVALKYVYTKYVSLTEDNVVWSVSPKIVTCVTHLKIVLKKKPRSMLRLPKLQYHYNNGIGIRCKFCMLVHMYFNWFYYPLVYLFL